jgi:hypothetical protein
LDQYDADGITRPVYTDLTIVPNVTVLRTYHITDLRSAVLAAQ